MASARNALLVVAKRPAPGQTKTRLTPPLSPEQAAALYECLLRDTLDLIRRVPDVQPVIAFLPDAPQDGRARDYFAALAPDFELLPQEGADLGARLDNALSHYLARGYERVAIMNSDGPTLPVCISDRRVRGAWERRRCRARPGRRWRLLSHRTQAACAAAAARGAHEHADRPGGHVGARRRRGAEGRSAADVVRRGRRGVVGTIARSSWRTRGRSRAEDEGVLGA